MSKKWKIVQVKDNLPVPLYTLSSIDDKEVLIGNFYHYQITPVKQTEHRIEKVLKTNKKTGKLFVKWEGYPDRLNSWIDNKDIKDKYE